MCRLCSRCLASDRPWSSQRRRSERRAVVQPAATEKRTTVSLRFVRVIGLTDLGIIALVGLVCTVAGWWTVAQ